VLEALSIGGSVKHVTLVTGPQALSQPVEATAKAHSADTVSRGPPRLDLKKISTMRRKTEVFAAAGRDGYSWSIHRPHTIIGYAIGNAMNMGATLAPYATICRETGRPFLFPGSATQWNGLTDMTDAAWSNENSHFRIWHEVAA